MGSGIAARNRRSLATFHRTLKSQCIIAVSCLGNRAISGVQRWASQSQKSQKSLRFRCAKRNANTNTASNLSPSSGHVRPRQGTEICNFGAPAPLEALHWIFCFFSSTYVQFSKTSPLKSGESSEKSSGENRVQSP